MEAGEIALSCVKPYETLNALEGGLLSTDLTHNLSLVSDTFLWKCFDYDAA